MLSIIANSSRTEAVAIPTRIAYFKRHFGASSFALRYSYHDSAPLLTPFLHFNFHICGQLLEPLKIPA